MKTPATVLGRLLFLAFFISCMICSVMAQETVKTGSAKYLNPVFEPILADPTVVRADDGWFYAYGTMDDWGDGNGPRLVPVVRSKTLTDWAYVGDAFLKKPSWKEKGGIWAPDVVKVDGKYLMYYAFSTWGDSDPGIGLAIAEVIPELRSERA
jgi:arabinan endo-1,5-alpha-L-arabinosidase